MPLGFVCIHILENKRIFKKKCKYKNKTFQENDDPSGFNFVLYSNVLIHTFCLHVILMKSVYTKNISLDPFTR